MEQVILEFFKTMKEKADTLEKEIPEYLRVYQAKQGELAVTKTYMQILQDLLKNKVEGQDKEAKEKAQADALAAAQKAEEDAKKPSPQELEVERRKSAGICTHRNRIRSGRYEWCKNKKTKATDYCRKHNKELGLTNAKKSNSGRSS